MSYPNNQHPADRAHNVSLGPHSNESKKGNFFQRLLSRRRLATSESQADSAQSSGIAEPLEGGPESGDEGGCGIYGGKYGTNGIFVNPPTPQPIRRRRRSNMKLFVGQKVDLLVFNPAGSKGSVVSTLGMGLSTEGTTSDEGVTFGPKSGSSSLFEDSDSSAWVPARIIGLYSDSKLSGDKGYVRLQVYVPPTGTAHGQHTVAGWMLRLNNESDESSHATSTSDHDRKGSDHMGHTLSFKYRSKSKPYITEMTITNDEVPLRLSTPAGLRSGIDGNDIKDWPPIRSSLFPSSDIGSSQSSTSEQGTDKKSMEGFSDSLLGVHTSRDSSAVSSRYHDLLTNSSSRSSSQHAPLPRSFWENKFTSESPKRIPTGESTNERNQFIPHAHNLRHADLLLAMRTGMNVDVQTVPGDPTSWRAGVVVRIHNDAMQLRQLAASETIGRGGFTIRPRMIAADVMVGGGYVPGMVEASKDMMNSSFESGLEDFEGESISGGVTDNSPTQSKIHPPKYTTGTGQSSDSSKEPRAAGGSEQLRLKQVSSGSEEHEKSPIHSPASVTVTIPMTSGRLARAGTMAQRVNPLRPTVGDFIEVVSLIPEPEAVNGTTTTPAPHGHRRSILSVVNVPIKSIWRWAEVIGVETAPPGECSRPPTGGSADSLTKSSGEAKTNDNQKNVSSIKVRFLQPLPPGSVNIGRVHAAAAAGGDLTALGLWGGIGAGGTQWLGGDAPEGGASYDNNAGGYAIFPYTSGSNGEGEEEWIDLEVEEYRLRPLPAHGSTPMPSDGSGTSTSKSKEETPIVPTKQGLKRTPHSRAESVDMQTLQRDEAAFVSALRQQDIHVYQTKKDGNCLFRSVAFEIYGSEHEHARVRAKVVEHMRANADYFGPMAEVFGGTLQQYLAEMGTLGTWGGNMELCAIEEVYDRVVEIYNGAEWLLTRSMKPRGIHLVGELEPKIIAGITPIRLCFLGNCHYASVVFGEKAIEREKNAHSDSGIFSAVVSQQRDNSRFSMFRKKSSHLHTLSSWSPNFTTVDRNTAHSRGFSLRRPRSQSDSGMPYSGEFTIVEDKLTPPLGERNSSVLRFARIQRCKEEDPAIIHSRARQASLNAMQGRVEEAIRRHVRTSTLLRKDLPDTIIE